MRIIGIDPGLSNTGIGVIEKVANTGSGLQFVHAEVVQPSRGGLEKRLLYIYDHIRTVVANTSPEVMAVEDQFFGKNVQTAFKTGQARGAALLAAAQSGIPVVLLAPARVKQSVVGHGRASKEQVRHMVSQILAFKSLPESLDCSDALAVAICYAFAPKP